MSQLGPKQNSFLIISVPAPLIFAQNESRYHYRLIQHTGKTRGDIDDVVFSFNHHREWLRLQMHGHKMDGSLWILPGGRN